MFNILDPLNFQQQLATSINRSPTYPPVKKYQNTGYAENKISVTANSDMFTANSSVDLKKLKLTQEKINFFFDKPKKAKSHNDQMFESFEKEKKQQKIHKIFKLLELKNKSIGKMSQNKVLQTTIAKAFENHLDRDKNQKYLIETLADRIQTIVSLFVLTENQEQNDKQHEIIYKFFKKNIEYIYDEGHYGYFNPDNSKQEKWFYQYSNYGYDTPGQAGKITGTSASNRNYISNSHPFYNLALIVNLHHGTHTLPIKDYDRYGREQSPAPLVTLLTAPYIEPFAKNNVHSARQYTSVEKQPLHKTLYGTFINKEETSFAKQFSLGIHDFSLNDFFQPEGWKNALTHYVINKENAYIKMAALKDEPIAGASGTVIGVLSSHVRLLEFTNFMLKEERLNPMDIDLKSLKEDFTNISMALYAWMGLAGDHSLPEVAIAHEFWHIYCDLYLHSDGTLSIASQKEVDQIVSELNKLDYTSMFLQKVQSLHPDIFNTKDFSKLDLHGVF